MKINKVVHVVFIVGLCFSAIASIDTFAIPNTSQIISVDSNIHQVRIGIQYSDSTIIVGKSTTYDNIHYYSVPFKCNFWTEYKGNNGMNYNYFIVMNNKSNVEGKINNGEIKSMVLNKTLLTGRQEPYVQFFNKSCSTLYDGDVCVNELKKGDGQPYIYIQCNYT